MTFEVGYKPMHIGSPVFKIKPLHLITVKQMFFCKSKMDYRMIGKYFLKSYNNTACVCMHFCKELVFPSIFL